MMPQYTFGYTIPTWAIASLLASLAILGLTRLIFGYGYEFFQAVYCMQVAGLTLVMYLVANKGSFWGKMEQDCMDPSTSDTIKCVDASAWHLVQLAIAFSTSVLYLRRVRSTPGEPVQ